MALRPGPAEVLSRTEVAIDARLVVTGTWLFLSANLFFFAAWWFSFFYLRALDNNQSWMAQGVGVPNRAYGLVVLALVILTAVAYWGTSRVAVRSTLFRVLIPVSLVLGIAACLFQGYQMWHLGFGLTQGGYPSLFAGLTGSWLVEFLFAIGWLATVAMQAGPGGDTRVRATSAATFSWVLLFLAGAATINFLLLYLVA